MSRLPTHGAEWQGACQSSAKTPKAKRRCTFMLLAREHDSRIAYHSHRVFRV